MGTQIKSCRPAGPGEVFAPDVFDCEIGKIVPMTVEGRASTMRATIVAVEVKADGSSVQFTMDVEGHDFL